MKEILAILNSIEAVSSTNEKKRIIAEHKDNLSFREVVSMALDEGKRYSATDINYSLIGTSSGNLIDTLNTMSKKRGATQAEIDYLSSIIPDAETAEVVRRILTKDLRCGAGPALFNEIDKDWVFNTPYQRYKSFKHIDKIDFSNRILAQMKMDGLFAFCFGDSGKFVSRNGSIFFIPELTDTFQNIEWRHGRVLIGELVVVVNGKALPRKESNGIINKFISGNGDPDHVNNITYFIWGWVYEEDFRNKKSIYSYKFVWETLTELYTPHPQLKLVECAEVKSLAEALKFYKRMRRRDEEGAILKDADNLVWEDDQSGSKYGIKLKPEGEADFRIADAYLGKAGKKYAAILGGLVIASEDGKIITKVGMGFSDEERALGVNYWKKQIGKIVTCRFTGITTDKTSRETWCLDHCRFIETRFNEKTKADTYDYVMGALKHA